MTQTCATQRLQRRQRPSAGAGNPGQARYFLFPVAILQGEWVAVGTAIADRPPHRSVRAALPHTAPTSDNGVKRKHDAHPPNPGTRRLPVLCRGRVALAGVLLGSRPSLHHLRRGLRLVVRLLHRCRVGGGALTRWPPSAAQTARTVFPYAAFTKTASEPMRSKELVQPG